ncbi:hypothetical protein VIGAN_10155300 [Vigna angularis var. angularis]|uniref:Uncharacterized protein n=1 Tax=Vigna angularis var. angularis TaxID=157739 RepID=A0A0S3T532_PHAAN|nr:hypothetical protein VIGAN_10155300 [Vigna angularis var. angularis]
MLKILALLGSGDKQASGHMYTVLGDKIRKSDSMTNIGNAVLYDTRKLEEAKQRRSHQEGVVAATSRRCSRVKEEKHGMERNGEGSPRVEGLLREDKKWRAPILILWHIGVEGIQAGNWTKEKKNLARNKEGSREYVRSGYKMQGAAN